MTLKIIIVLAGLLCISIYAISFGRWTWRRKNKLGAIMIYIVALMAFALPIYSLFFREA